MEGGAEGSIAHTWGRLGWREENIVRSRSWVGVLSIGLSGIELDRRV